MNTNLKNSGKISKTRFCCSKTDFLGTLKLMKNKELSQNLAKVNEL